MVEHIAFGDTPVSRCSYYRRVCDLPAVIDPPHLGRITMTASYVWGLMMPAHLGQAVLAHMRGVGAEIGPVMSHPRSLRWTFLVRPNLSDDVSLFAEMFRHNVSVVRDGGTIALPSPTDQRVEFRRWVEPPRCIFRPSGLVVVEPIRACAVFGAHRPVIRGQVRGWNADRDSRHG